MLSGKPPISCKVDWWGGDGAATGGDGKSASQPFSLVTCALFRRFILVHSSGMGTYSQWREGMKGVEQAPIDPGSRCSTIAVHAMVKSETPGQL